MIVSLSEKYAMDDVFLNDQHSHLVLSSHDDWSAVGEERDTSFLPSEESVVHDAVESSAEVLAVQMDIAAPLTILKTILGEKLGADLSHCQLWLQDILQLNEDNTLAEQCVQGQGLVQVNLELKAVQNEDRINIIDVLKPQVDVSAEQIYLDCDIIPSQATLEETPIEERLPELDQAPSDSGSVDTPPAAELQSNNTNISFPVKNPPTLEEVPRTTSRTVRLAPAQLSNGADLNRNQLQAHSTSSENITRWVMDGAFRKEQERLKIPFDPALWTKDHVQHWIRWSINQFRLEQVYANQWLWIDGRSLCQITHQQFTEMVPCDPNDLFWTHLELLRKCKFVGVIQKPVPYLQYVTTPLNLKGDLKSAARPAKMVQPSKIVTQSEVQIPTAAGNRTGNNGQVQLWQFLLELLTDRNSRDAISWMGVEGEFKLNNPEMVAQLWGERKNKPHMNYEKLSRALRYYYDGDMICKVHGKRFVYKFVCDLKQLLGYSAEELNNLVMQSSSAPRSHHH